jgi:hypothetical protein
MPCDSSDGFEVREFGLSKTDAFEYAGAPTRNTRSEATGEI